MSEEKRQLNLAPLEVTCTEHNKKTVIFPAKIFEVNNLTEIQYKCGFPVNDEYTCKKCKLNVKYHQLQEPGA